MNKQDILNEIAELKDWTTPINDSDNCGSVRKYCILQLLDKVVVNYGTTYKFSDLVFESEEAAKKAIEAVGEDRIVKYYFRKGEKNA